MRARGASTTTRRVDASTPPPPRTARAMSTKRTKREALGKEIADDALAKPRSKRKQTKARARTAGEEDYLPDALSTKILREAKELR